MKVLILDVDYRKTGTSSIGSDERIEEVFGFKPLHIKSFSKFEDFMKTGVEEVKLSEYETEYRLKAPYDKADMIVIDSATGLQTMIKRAIQRPNVLFNQQDYGKLGDKMEEILYKFACLDKSVIFTAHTQDTEDSELGRIIEIPGFVGQTRDKITRYFDLVLYTVVTSNKLQKTINYQWQAVPDERRNARALSPVTEQALLNNGLIEQDFAELFRLIRTTYNDSVKIGIFGKAGTGKTHALRTLKNVP